MGAKKQLGQNFLQNKKKLLKMVDVLDPALDGVVEIGPGHGELTRHIVERGFSVICIEKDKDMVSVLQKKFEGTVANGKLKIIEGDALGQLKTNNKKLLITEEYKKSYAIIGNIPYYITGHLLRIIAELKHKPKQVVLLIQEEVAYRLCAQKGDMNLLAASIGWWARARVITRVPRQMFSPSPQVDSAVVLLTSIDPNTLTKQGFVKEGEEAYFKCVHAIFKQPRRMVVKNLVDAGILRERAERALIDLSVGITARPQNLSVEDTAALSILFRARGL